MMRSLSLFFVAACVIVVSGNMPARAAEVQFNVLPAQSDVVVSITLDTPAGGDTATDTSTMIGTITAFIDTPVAPFGNIQIVDLQLSTGESTSLNFCFAEFIVCLAGVDVTAAPGDLTVILDVPGAPAPVVAGDFTQTANDMALIGNINVDATGLADGQIPEGPFILDSGTIVNDLPGSIHRNGDTFILMLDLSAEGFVDDPDTGVMTDFSMTGSIVATGELVPSQQGDLDCSGTADVNDAPLMVEALLSPTTFSGCDLQRADVNEDAVINGLDVAAFVAAVLAN